MIILKPLSEHAAAVRSASEFVRDERYTPGARRGAQMFLDELLNGYAFIDNKLEPGHGYAINQKWPFIMDTFRVCYEN